MKTRKTPPPLNTTFILARSACEPRKRFGGGNPKILIEMGQEVRVIAKGMRSFPDGSTTSEQCVDVVTVADPPRFARQLTFSYWGPRTWREKKQTFVGVDAK